MHINTYRALTPLQLRVLQRACDLHSPECLLNMSKQYVAWRLRNSLTAGRFGYLGQAVIRAVLSKFDKQTPSKAEG